MADSPASPSEKTLVRVLTISRVNGWGVAVVSGLGTLLSLGFADWSGAAVGAVVCFAGCLEISGNRQLQRRDANGMSRLINAQMLTLAVMLIYSTVQLQFFDVTTVTSRITPEMEALFEERGLFKEQIPEVVRLLATAVYATLGITSIIYQGGLMFYYRSRRRLVTEALAKPPVL
ncbi:hypothetical protein [Oleiharenicola lentus]|uniref:hypothetical protein n=1 Tax=Oleiharenicola lentus TaxID=2508720 RepID=UPI003F670AA6